ncbi:MAG TPA: hypothetical protein VFQ06_00495 [Nitrospira sp.]|nr:hypothetical protein [Nitrospira sp.]
MEIRIRKGYSQPKGFWYVEVTSDGDTASAGFVFKSDVSGRWEHSKGADTYRTRREAIDALMPFAAVELAAVKHYANATSNDPERSFYQGEIYKASKRALIGAIQAAYPDVDVDDVYELWVDCGECIAYCVEYLRTQRRAFQAEMDAQHAEAMEEDAAREEWKASGDELDRLTRVETHRAHLEAHMVVRADGSEVVPGDRIRVEPEGGHVVTLVKLTRAPGDGTGTNGKILVASEFWSSDREYYPSVFDLKVVPRPV